MISITTFYRAVHAKLCHLLFKDHLNKNTMVCPWQSTCPAFDNGTLDGKNEGERWVIAGDFSRYYVHKQLLNGLLSSGEANMSNLCYEFQCICSAPPMFAMLNLLNLFLLMVIAFHSRIKGRCGNWVSVLHEQSLGYERRIVPFISNK